MTGSDSTGPEGNRFVALCTGATGISSVHLIRRLQQDSRFSKVYGVSRRELYDVDTANVQHIKLDLLDSQKVKDELKAKGVSDGKYCRSAWEPCIVKVELGLCICNMQHLSPLLLFCSDPSVPGGTKMVQVLLKVMMTAVCHTSTACPL